MRSVVNLNIQGPRDPVAALFADPMNIAKWMDDIDRCEPISGAPGLPGSTYRMVPKSGNRVFVATVLSRDLPREVRLQLDAADMTVWITDRFSALSENATRLVSEEEFRFQSALRRLFGFLAQPLIRRAHRRHMVAFKRFAEDRARNSIS